MDAVQQNLVNIARMAYGSGFFEGTSGGVGQMGILRDEAGNMRVVKFNTHRSEQGNVATASDAAKTACNELRTELLRIATEKGLDADRMNAIRRSLGLPEGEGEAPKSLLDRKVVARVVKMIDANVWDKALADDAGTGRFDIASLKSSSAEHGTQFSQVASGVSNRSIGMQDLEFRKEFAEIVKMTKAGIFGNTSIMNRIDPRAADAFERILDFAVEQRLSVPRRRAVRDGALTVFEGGDKAELAAFVKTTFMRTLVAFDQTDLLNFYAKSILGDLSENPAETRGFQNLARVLQGFVEVNKSLGDATVEMFFREQAVMHLYKNGPEQALGGYPTDTRECLSPSEIGTSLAQAMTEALNMKKAGVSAPPQNAVRPNGASLEQRVEAWQLREAKRIAAERELAEARGALLEELDALEEGVLSKDVIPAFKKVILAESSSEKIGTYKEGLAFVKAHPVTSADKEAVARLMPDAKSAERLLLRLRDIQVSQVLCGKRPNAKLGDYIAFFAENKAFRDGLDLTLDLSKTESMKKGIQSFVSTSWAKIETSSDFQTYGVYALPVREFFPGFVTVNGQEIPPEPSREFRAVKLSGASGTEIPSRQAFVEQMTQSIPDKRQRALAMLFTSMADGVEGFFGGLFSEQVKNDGFHKGLTQMASVELTNGQTFLGSTAHGKLHQITTLDDGTVKLRCHVGFTQVMPQFEGQPVGIGPLNCPIADADYLVEITIPKPQPGEAGMPAFTIDRIDNL